MDIVLDIVKSIMLIFMLWLLRIWAVHNVVGGMLPCHCQFLETTENRSELRLQIGLVRFFPVKDAY